jgi:phosphoribosylformylglycinamidine (FGAM) synthase PurS component
VLYNVNISQMSYAIIEVDADSKEEAEQKVKDMSHSEIDDNAQHRSTSDFIEVIEVDEVKTTQAKL